MDDRVYLAMFTMYSFEKKPPCPVVGSNTPKRIFNVKVSSQKENVPLLVPGPT
jgi:hypothetical protein